MEGCSSRTTISERVMLGRPSVRVITEKTASTAVRETMMKGSRDEPAKKTDDEEKQKEGKRKEEETKESSERKGVKRKDDAETDRGLRYI